LIFISLVKDKKKPTKEATARVTKMLDELSKKGIKILGFYWTWVSIGLWEDMMTS